MLRNRLVLCLMLKGDLFVNSRNFTLNPVGNLETILTYLHFDSIDELVVLNVSRGGKDMDAFGATLKRLVRRCFIPVAAGGGVRSMADCERLLKAGADKIVVNTAVYDAPEVMREAARTYGSQCMVHSIDVKMRRSTGIWDVYVEDGSRAVGEDVFAAARRSEELGIGEIFLTSVDRDGTCQGYDLPLVERVSASVGVPVIASGGVGEFKHFIEGISAGANAVSAGNIFHFLGDALRNAKQYVSESGMNFPAPMWNFQHDHKL